MKRAGKHLARREAYANGNQVSHNLLFDAASKAELEAPPRELRSRVRDVHGDRETQAMADVGGGQSGIAARAADEAIGAGTRFRETRVLYGREATEEIEVTAFEEPDRYVAETLFHGTRFTSEFRFTERDG